MFQMGLWNGTGRHHSSFFGGNEGLVIQSPKDEGRDRTGLWLFRVSSMIDGFLLNLSPESSMGAWPFPESLCYVGVVEEFDAGQTYLDVKCVLVVGFLGDICIVLSNLTEIAIGQLVYRNCGFALDRLEGILHPEVEEECSRGFR